MNRITIFYILLMIFHMTCYICKASHYIPNVYYAKPSKDKPYMTNASINFTSSFANTAFNKNGQSVPFLQQYGPEDFLWRFVNPSLGPDNLDSAGQGYISGKYNARYLHFSLEKNLSHQCLCGVISSFQDLTMSAIRPSFIYPEDSLLPSQITYLEQLSAVIPQTVNISGMKTTMIYCAYNENMTDFNHIKDLDLLLLIGISSPQIVKDDNYSVFQYSPANNYYFGYPVIGSITVGVNNWFSLGITGLVIPYQPVQMIIPINKTGENNFLLFSQKTQAHIHQDPFISGSMYIELEQQSSGIQFCIAYTYSKYLQSTITPLDKIQFPEAHANKSILFDGYSFGSLLFELQFDCSQPNKTLAPIISFYCAIPIIGNYYQQEYYFGGELNLEINLIF